MGLVPIFELSTLGKICRFFQFKTAMGCILFYYAFKEEKKEKIYYGMPKKEVSNQVTIYKLSLLHHYTKAK
jgi:hypothetical protein